MEYPPIFSKTRLSSLNTNALLFSICVLVWGSTWIAINFQIKEAALMVSVGVRFAIAAAIIGVWCIVKKRSFHLSLEQHKLVAMAGAFLYALDYSFLYAAQQHIVSALLAVLSSSVIYFNVILRRIVLKKPVRSEVVLGASIGLLGIFLIFAPELQVMSTSQGLAAGLILAFGSFLSAGIGNVISEKVLDKHISVLQMNFWAMLYGVCLTFVIVFVTDTPLTLPSTSSYYYALLYLAVFGSVIAFGAYMQLVKQMGSDKAAYVVLVYPIVALAISTVFENYVWTISSMLGVIAVLIGNAIAMGKLTLPTTKANSA
ncbi:DMT family transporter [Agaribacter flavus]|uniref:DMT family transporter n=1 Tax=Agaribacter flavus TaxID=1902781 RepID=A0ABV7FM90_9ALTE